MFYAVKVLTTHVIHCSQMDMNIFTFFCRLNSQYSNFHRKPSLVLLNKSKCLIVIEDLCNSGVVSIFYKRLIDKV